MIICEGFFFFAGLYGLITGRFRIGERRVVGRRARLIGAVLILPLAFGLTLGFIIGMKAGLSGGGIDDINWDAISSVATLELLMMIGALVAAVALVFTAPEAETVSGTPSHEAFPPVSVPSVMTLAEAAQYLRISQAEVIQLIDDGKIAAARIGGDYRIARVVLDELLQSREN